MIPCFDDKDVLPLLFDRLRKAAEHWGAEYEVVLIDDGARDDTWEWICDAHRRDPGLKGVRRGRS